MGAHTQQWAFFLWHGLDPKTRQGYKSGIASYENFCKMFYPLRQIWPASEDLLCAWAAQSLSPQPGNPRLKHTTVANYLSALRSHHVDQRISVEVFSSPTLRRILKGAANVFGTFVAKRFPITRDALGALTEDVPITPLEYTLRACFLLAFAAFLRMGEVTWEAKDRTDAARFIQTKATRGDIRISPTGDHMIFRVKRSKTDKNHTGTSIVIAAVDSPLCAVKAMIALFARDPKGPNEPLFSWNTGAFTKAKLNKYLKEKLKSKGYAYESVSLHSFRKGAAQFASDNGLRDDQIQLLGRWTSDAFHRYYTASEQTLLSTSVLFQTGQPMPMRDFRGAYPTPPPGPAFFGTGSLRLP